MIPPAPTLMLVVPAATAVVIAHVAALAIPVAL
jgi:hypothetical protein